ncbi:hypothetical protein J1614_003679 [Plenodomus biglobosus]|nr:hypothetical protein J1614_003679 [Plenodomus biglobosus]
MCVVSNILCMLPVIQTWEVLQASIAERRRPQPCGDPLHKKYHYARLDRHLAWKYELVPQTNNLGVTVLAQCSHSVTGLRILRALWGQNIPAIVPPKLTFLTLTSQIVPALSCLVCLMIHLGHPT